MLASCVPHSSKTLMQSRSSLQTKGQFLRLLRGGQKKKKTYRLSWDGEVEESGLLLKI